MYVRLHIVTLLRKIPNIQTSMRCSTIPASVRISVLFRRAFLRAFDASALKTLQATQEVAKDPALTMMMIMMVMMTMMMMMIYWPPL